MPVSVSIIVPEGAAPGQQLGFTHTDGRNVTLTIPPGVVPGQKLQVNIPDVPGSAPPKPAKKKYTKKREREEPDTDEDEEDLDPSDEEFEGRHALPEGEMLVNSRPARGAAQKAKEEFSKEVTDEDFEEALKLQQQKAEAAAIAAKQARAEREKQRIAQALLLAKAAEAADAEVGEDEEEFEIEAIVEVKRGPLGLVYHIKWKGEEEKTWEPEASLHPELVADFKRDHPDLIQQALDGECEIEIVAAPPPRAAQEEVAVPVTAVDDAA